MLIITQKSTTYLSKDNIVLSSRDNQIVLKQEGQQKIIIAVGSRHEWESSEPLPSDSLIINLIAESLKASELAVDLWEVLLIFVLYSGSSKSMWQELKMTFSALPRRRIPVKISIDDPVVSRAIRNSLLQCKASKFLIQENE